MGVIIASIGGLYAGLFKARVADYLPYVAIGFVIWSFVSGLINEGCNALTARRQPGAAAVVGLCVPSGVA